MLLKRFYIFVYITYRGKSSVPEPAPLKNKLLVNMYYTLLVNIYYTLLVNVYYTLLVNMYYTLLEASS